MTNEEAIIKSALKYLVKMQIEEGSVGFAVDNDHDHDCCWDDVLAWLEAQPCEDAVSRAEAIDKLTKFYNMVLDDNGTKLNIRDIVGTLERLPSVTPQRPKGEWIKIPITLCHYPCDGCAKDKSHANDEWCSSCEFWKAKDFDYKCSECGKIYSEVENYCPNCGAEMSGGGEDEV